MSKPDDPVFDIVLKVIKDSKTECGVWIDASQRELAIEIMYALEQDFTLKFEPKP